MLRSIFKLCIFSLTVGCLPHLNSKNFKGTIPLIPSASSIPGQIIITPSSNLFLNESGTTAFTIQLDREPKANVYLNSISLSGTNMATISVGNIVIAQKDWNLPHTVTIRGVQNESIDKERNFTISLGTSSSPDSDFDNLDAGVVTGEVIDDDIFGITVTPNSGLTTTNGGGDAIFKVVTNKKGNGSYTISIPIKVDTPGIAEISSSTLYFTEENWDIPQVVKVTGIKTSQSIGKQPYTISIGPSFSLEPELNGYSTTISLTNLDENTDKFDITPLSGLVTTKSGGSATIQIRLTSEPTSNLQIPIFSSNPTQGMVTPSLLVFTTSNWNIYKTVTIKGVNNKLLEGDKSYSIIFGQVLGGGSLEGKSPSSVSVLNVDSNSPGIQLSSSYVARNEGSTQVSISAKLNTIPTSNVVINLTSTNTSTGGNVSPSKLTFTPTNWNNPQNINITPVARNYIQNLNINYNINFKSSSADSNYNGLTLLPINATTVNLDFRGYSISKTNNFYISGSRSVNNFSLKLNTIPLGGNVVIPVHSLSAKARVTPSSLNFTATNWNIPQTITIEGLDDNSTGTSTGQIQIGKESSPFYPEAGSSDYSTNNIPIGDYNGQSPGNIDFQYTGIEGGKNKIIAVIPAGVSLQTFEGGPSFDYYLHLYQAPTSPVSIPLSIANSNRAGVVNSISLQGNYNQFTTTNKVSITTANDNFITGNTSVVIQHGILSSLDPLFNNYNASNQNFSLNIIDVNTFGVQRNQISGATDIVTEYEGLYNSAIYRIRLSARPNPGQICHFYISSSDPSAATVSPPSMTFTSGNWNSYQNLTITGSANSKLNFNRPFFIKFSNTISGQNQFNNQIINSIGMSVHSNAIIVSSPMPSSETTVSGQNSSFTIVLNSPPTGTVTIDSITSSNINAGRVSPSSISFTTGNWNIPQTITVYGINPIPIQNGIVPYEIIFSKSSSSDKNYDLLSIPPISMKNLDN